MGTCHPAESAVGHILYSRELLRFLAFLFVRYPQSQILPQNGFASVKHPDEIMYEGNSWLKSGVLF